MIEMHPTVVLLLVEALAVLVLVQVVSLLLAWLRRRRESAAVAALVGSVTDDAEGRRERNGTAIGTALGANGDALQEHVKAVEQATKLVLQRVVLGWSRRDASSVATLPEALEALNDKWRVLLGLTGTVTATTNPALDKAHEDALAALAAEKKAVEDELAITRETMTRMLNEYAAMYHRGGRDGESKTSALLDEGVAGDGEVEPTSTPMTAAAAVAPAAEAARTGNQVASAATGSDDAGDVTEDDLDALFDARPDEGRNGSEAEAMPADLDIEDPFDGLDIESDADVAEPGEDQQQGATVAAAG